MSPARRLAAWSAALVVLLALGAPGSATATPVKCAATDTTPGDRVFPEPRDSIAFLRFDEFRCGIELLNRQHPDRMEIKVLGTSKGGHPLYDVELTNEATTTKKEKLLIVSSIHGGEVGGRSGGARVLEDLLDRRFLGDAAWVKSVLDQYVVHFVFPNPDGWVAGDVLGTEGAGFMATRGNDSGRDLNRQFPVKGWISTPNATLEEPEGNAVIDRLLGSTPSGWYLGTDNHGQGPDTYAAAGLQIVGQFDFQKSETLARFADGITATMEEYSVLDTLGALNRATGQDLGPYHWGTLYDMLGYSASGSMIDYYNTADGVDGTGFATELTAGTEVNYFTYPALLDQVWADSIRAINYTMLRQSIDRKRFTYPVKGRAAYVFDPAVVRHDDANGAGYVRQPGEDLPQKPYAVTRMRFFEDLNRSADRPLAKLRVADIVSGAADLQSYDSLVLADSALPEAADEGAWYAALKRWVESGGNLIVTDGAAPVLAKLGLVPDAAVTKTNHYVGFASFTDRSHPLNAGLRGVASQTYDTVPIGYGFDTDSAPNWKVAQAAWEGAGGTTLGTNGTGQTIYGELPVAKGRVRFLGALLPQPTEAFYHPYGLQNYAVTYTGYTLLANMLNHEAPGRTAPRPSATKPVKRCRARVPFTVTVKLPASARVRGARVVVNGVRATIASRRGRTVKVRVRADRLRGISAVVRVRTRRAGGRIVEQRRSFRLCARKRR